MHHLNTSILVTTCKGYGYIMPAFIAMWKKYWSDCPFTLNICIDGEFRNLATTRNINLIPRENDPGYIDSWIYGLEHIDSENVILMQDDFIIERKVNNDLVEAYCNIMNENQNVGFIRIMPFPEPIGHIHTYNNIQLKQFNKNERYVFSFQACLWKRKLLIEYFKFIIEKAKKEIIKEYGQNQLKIWAADPKKWLDLFLRDIHNPEGHGFELFNLFPEYIYLGFFDTRPKLDKAMICPIPYNPTAIWYGRLTCAAQRLFKKEQISVETKYSQREHFYHRIIPRYYYLFKQLVKILISPFYNKYKKNNHNYSKNID